MTTRARRPSGKKHVGHGRERVSALEAHLGYWLRAVSNHVSHAFATKVERHGVTVAEWVVMRALLDEDGLKPSALADRVGLTRGAVSKLIERLVSKGLVSSRDDRTDGRAQRIKLTAKGRALVPTLAALADQNDAEAFGHLTLAQKELLMEVLESMVERHQLKAPPLA